MILCDKHGIAYDARSFYCPVCEAEKEIRRHEKCQEGLRIQNEMLLDALKRMVGNCERYLEERPASESEEYNLDYVSPLKQAHTAIRAAEGGTT